MIKCLSDRERYKIRMSKIRIAFVETNCKKNGPIKQTLNIIRNMDREIFEPYLITVWPEELDNSMIDEYKNLGISVYSANVSKKKSIIFGKQAIKKILKEIKPDIVQGVGMPPYSIHDAIEAGFNKIVFIIRKDIKDAFKEAIGDRIEKICNNLAVEIAYAYQELSELPEGVEIPTGRTKPWGTGQAVLACKEVLHEPFAVINADDYYGKEAFVKLHDFLVGYAPEKANQFCMAGFILKNTLSENGAVTRGICETNEEGYLTAVHETSNIVKTPEGAAVDNDGQLTSINAESYASMNMWGLTPEFMQTLEDGFKEFFANMGDKDILKAEYLLPIYIDELLQSGKVSVKVLDTNDKWFGVTYKEDKDYVVKSFAKLIEAGVYQKNLFEDLK